MAGPRTLGVLLLALAGFLLLAEPSRATERPVPLAERSWRTAPARLIPAEPDAVFHRTGLQVESSGHGGNQGTGPEEGHEESGRFHVTTLRLWLYRNLLPKSDDSTILGIEVDSAWSWGYLDFTNISYVEVADYPRAVPGKPVGNPLPELGSGTGITDLLTAFLVSPKRAHHGPHHFAAGVGAQFPTATDPTLGSEKWCVGPAIEYEYEKGRLFAGFVALQLWSFAGASDRKDVSMLMVKPMITYDLTCRWKAVYMPYGISVYWNKSRGEQVYLPLGGGFQYDFRLGRQKTAVSLQYFQYVIRPSKGAEGDLRLMLQFAW